MNVIASTIRVLERDYKLLKNYADTTEDDGNSTTADGSRTDDADEYGSETGNERKNRDNERGTTDDDKDSDAKESVIRREMEFDERVIDEFAYENQSGKKSTQHFTTDCTTVLEICKSLIRLVKRKHPTDVANISCTVARLLREEFWWMTCIEALKDADVERKARNMVTAEMLSADKNYDTEIDLSELLRSHGESVVALIRKRQVINDLADMLKCLVCDHVELSKNETTKAANVTISKSTKQTLLNQSVEIDKMTTADAYTVLNTRCRVRFDDDTSKIDVPLGLEEILSVFEQIAQVIILP